MNVATHTIRRLAQGIAVMIGAAAMVVPASAAGTGAHDGAPDPWYRNAVAQATRTDTGTQLVTDTLAPGGDNASSPDPLYRHAVALQLVTDTLAPGGGSSTPAPTQGRFDWGDAGIGAAGAIGLVLVMVGGTLAVFRRRGPLAF